MLAIAREHQLDLPINDEQKFRSMVQVVNSDPLTFQNFLSKFATLREFYQSPEAIRRVAREAVIDAANDNVRYMELRFTPVALTRVRDYPLAEAMDWVIESVAETSNQYGIKTQLIASVNRHESVKLAEEVMRLAVDRIGNGIIGLDLAGSEAEFPGEEFEPVFLEAKQAGLKITIHAGEWGGPEIISLAVKTLHADRIGHGVRVMEDPVIVDLCKDKGIVFEVCPTSNYQSGVVTSMPIHPLPKMIGAGLVCTLNTDDPGISQIELTDEYQLGIEALGIPDHGLVELTMNAVRASFLPKKEQDILAAQLGQELSDIL